LLIEKVGVVVLLVELVYVSELRNGSVPEAVPTYDAGRRLK
jgi:hypothetical protein